MQESEIAVQWVYKTLSQDSTLMSLINGVHDTAIPERYADDLPRIQISVLDSRPLKVVDRHKIFTRVPVLVRIVNSSTSFSDIHVAANRVDALLHRQGGVADDGAVLSSELSRELREADRVDGKEYRNLGGEYFLIVKAT